MWEQVRKDAGRIHPSQRRPDQQKVKWRVNNRGDITSFSVARLLGSTHNTTLVTCTLAKNTHWKASLFVCPLFSFFFSTGKKKIERRRRKFYADGKKNMENGQDNKLNVKMRWCDSMQSAWWCHLQNRQMVYIYMCTLYTLYILLITVGR